ncbi:hypothetical protein KOW79_011287 [Hemibagrus wyckioides]|uniref:Uncharacterized protein n=1 Tax=Hemibagrus wyckioides TaxID=337641 RepID=A0A9D3NK01_9TELE|nr:hypothetical protein KOW79_011287 [Hemibagrus wyckioides]
MDQMILQEVQEKRKMAEDKAKKRRLKTKVKKRGATCSESEKGKKEDVQVPELMRKIEHVVAKNKSCPFQLEKEIRERFERKCSIVNNGTEQKMLQGSMHIIQPSMGDDCYYDDDDDDDDDKSSGFGSALSLQLGTSSISSLRGRSHSTNSL